MKHDAAFKVAEALVGHLRPACERIEIAGSIRRMKPEVKDIEIVAIPDLSIAVPRTPLEFGKPIPPVYKTELDRLIAEMEKSGDIRIEKSGDRMKAFYLNYAGIKVDLFLVLPPATWGVQMVIRTGPADFSHWCVTRMRSGGTLPNGFRVQDGAVWTGEKQVASKQVAVSSVGFEEERGFLDFLGLGWVDPRERVAKWR